MSPVNGMGFSGDEMEKKMEQQRDSELRYNCLSLAASVVNADGNLNKDHVFSIAKEMYEWVKGE